MDIYLVQFDGIAIDAGGKATTAVVPAGLTSLQLDPLTYLVDDEEVHAALLPLDQAGASRVHIRVATDQDLPGTTAIQPTTDEIVTFVQAAKRKRGHPEQQPVATDRASVLVALNNLLCGK